MILFHHILRSLFVARNRVLEELLRYFHPQLLLDLDILRLVSILLRQVDLVTLKSQLNSLRVQVQNPVQDDLGVFKPVDLLADLPSSGGSFFIFFLDQLVLLLFAKIQRIVNLKENRLATLLPRLNTSKILYQLAFIIALRVQIKGHIMHRLLRPPAEPNTLLHHILPSFRNGVLGDTAQSRHQLGNIDISELLCLLAVD